MVQRDVPCQQHSMMATPKECAGEGALHVHSSAKLLEAGCLGQPFILVTLCYEATQREVPCAASHWALQKTREHSCIHTHTHTARDTGEEHTRKEEQPLLPAVLLQNIIFTIKEKFSTGSAPLSQMSNKWI